MLGGEHGSVAVFLTLETLPHTLFERGGSVFKVKNTATLANNWFAAVFTVPNLLSAAYSFPDRKSVV